MALYCRAVYGRLWGPSRAREMIASEALAAGKLSRAIARVELAISLLLPNSINSYSYSYYHSLADALVNSIVFNLSYASR